MDLPKNPNLEIDYSTTELDEIVLAGGCFWGTQAFLRRIKGVASTVCGYANGTLLKPTYKQVCSGETGHAEAVRVQYDPACLSLQRLLEAYFETIDPTTVNRQVADIGEQYRSGIYYMNSDDLADIQTVYKAVQSRYDTPLAVEICALNCFYPAEAYHQDYLEKNPNGYCHVDFSRFHEA